ncbi:Uma2 family endonuclease [Catenibacillus scindens]|uniref:Uma2 family endonuclease n=1 Tax=Catenibacillus scindens TaxID=673271 RepID=UPI001613FC45|nr:Uma2 family endonuclease [Catenibacillus scindens]
MPLEQKKQYTVDDIYALPDGVRAELIDGEMYMMAPPGLTHQNISAFLHNTIYSYIHSKHGECVALAAPFAVFLNDDDQTYVEPDISVICDKSKLDEKGCHGAPDWVIEIVSQSSRSRDYLTKLFKYQTAGVREYWIVDPISNQVIVYQFETGNVASYPFADEIPVGIYDGDLRLQIKTE